MTASNEDLQLFALYRDALKSGMEPAQAREFARGRDVSGGAFDEAIRRAEDELLTLPGTQDVRRSFEGMGLSESAARVEAVDWAWSCIEEARERPPAPASGRELSEAEKIAASNAEFAHELAEVRKGRGRTAASRPPATVELREVEGAQAQLEEAFRAMGMSDDAARDAAKGR